MNVAVILAGGTGSRAELDIPKQYYEVDGRPVIAYCLQTFLVHECIDAMQIVADEMWHGYIMQQLFALPGREKFKGFSMPGKNRQLSVYHAFRDIRGYASADDFVIIHDAARPCDETVGNKGGFYGCYIWTRHNRYASSDVSFGVGHEIRFRCWK